MFNETMLKIKLLERNSSVEKLSHALNIDRSTFYRKVNRGGDFSREEIQIVREVLSMSAEEAEAVFFAHGLTETQDSA